ncbi:MAG: mechanosensitive ion channel, partial [Acidobacteria bacterium]|nr:mechanosensitive ion channel [Acidobacteriota bacterium]
KVVRVQSMGIRSTIVRTLDDEALIVPNAELVQSVVTNFTLKDTLYRRRVTVGVAYESDLRQVDAVLNRTAKDLSWRCPEPEPRVLLRAFGSSSVDFEVSVWIDDPWRMARRRSDLHHAVWWALKEAGITIAFPQLDVHFDASLKQLLAEAAGGQRRGEADG